MTNILRNGQARAGRIICLGGTACQCHPQLCGCHADDVSYDADYSLVSDIGDDSDSAGDYDDSSLTDAVGVYDVE